MRFATLALLFFAIGCTRPRTGQEDVVVDPPSPIVDPEKKEDAGVPQSISIAAPKNTVDAAHQFLGDSGAIPPQRDLTIKAGEVKITIHPGGTIDYAYNSEKDSMLFTFNEPRPTVEVAAGPFKIHPPLLSLNLLPDNTGVATVQTMIGKVNRKVPLNFNLNWSAEAQQAISQMVQESDQKRDGILRFHTMKGCPPCERGKKELAEAKEAGKLPFEYEITEDAVDFTESRPVLTCQSMGKIWTPVYAADDPKIGAKKGDVRPGWYGVDDAIMWWKQVPKK
jgi:hypothetical protein